MGRVFLGQLAAGHITNPRNDSSICLARTKEPILPLSDNAPAPVPSWTSSSLWQHLSVRPEDDDVKLLLHNCLPTIQEVLAKGATGPKDFTLHDAGHGFRVAEWMARVVPADVSPENDGSRN